MTGIGVSLSGGGHRASLFGLGVLLYLVEADKQGDVSSISSVSGGSITNAYVAQTLELRETTSDAFRKQIAPLATQLAQRGTLQWRSPGRRFKVLAATLLLATAGIWAIPELSRPTRYAIHLLALALVALPLSWWLFATALGRAYGVVLVVGLAAVALPPWAFDWPAPLDAGILRLVMFIAGLAVWVALLFSRRGYVCEASYRRTLFARHGRSDRIEDTHSRGIDHVLCSTDLQSGEHVYFARDFVYGYRVGQGKPNGLRLSRAVRASANLPFAFPPLWLRASRFGFRYAADQQEARPAEERRPCPEPEHRLSTTQKRWLVLSDGGVYDNMADQWPHGFENRVRCWPDLAKDHQEPEVLVVANASGGLGWQAMRRAAIPGLGGLLALLKVTDVLYDQTTALRRAGLVGRFDRSVLTGTGMRGALVHIPQSPFDVPRAFEQSRDWPDRAARARAVLAKLGDTEREWEQVAREDVSVPTVLSALGTRISAQLLRHGFVLAMSNLHVILDFPLLDSPPIAWFQAIVEGSFPSGEPPPSAEAVADSLAW
jgi:predicted acylesterase/phospholipase RssA